MSNQKKTIGEIANRIPLFTAMNGLFITPSDHYKSLVYYGPPTEDGHPATLTINTARNQWRSADGQHGDDTLSLLSLLYDEKMDESNPRMKELVKAIINNNKYWSDRKRFEFKGLPIMGRSVAVVPYRNAIDPMFVPGISSPVLNKYCYVAYMSKREVKDDDPRVQHCFKAMGEVLDLHKLSDEDKAMVNELFRTAIALPNKDGGYQLFNGEESYPIGKDGYTLLGPDVVKKGEKCYVFENMADFLALMERRHMSGTEAIQPTAHHIILNGSSDNIAAAMQYLHEHCDYLDVVTFFPKDKRGQELFHDVEDAVRGTAKDGSYLYEDFFSLYQRVEGYLDGGQIEAKRAQLLKEVELAEKSYIEAQKQKNGQANKSDKEKQKALDVPSAFAKQTDERKRGGFKL